MPLDQTSIDPEEYRKRLAMSLAQSGMETTPIKSWTQGAARLAQALAGGLMMNQSSQQQSDAAKQLMGLLPIGQQQAAAMPTSGQQAPPTQGNVQLASLNGMPQSDTIAPVLKKMESGGDYNNVTTTKDRNGNDQHALGAYGVMNFNVGPWSQEILGRPLTPQEFLKDPKAQDAIALGKFNQYAAKYGGPEPAFRAWLGGEGNMNKPNAADALGTTVKGYSDKAMSLLAQQQGGQPTQQQAANLPQGPQPQTQAPQGNPDMMRGIQTLLASGNPYAQQYGRQLASTVIGQRLEPAQFEKMKGPLGEDIGVFVNRFDKTISSPQGGEGGGGFTTSGIGVYAPGVSRVDSSKTGEEYLNQFSPEVKSIVRAYINGDQMPTGNPRLQGMLPFAHNVATKYAMDQGIPFSDTIYSGKRQMQTQLSSGSPQSLGGRLLSLRNSLEHLANTSDAVLEKGNVDLYAWPFSAPVNEIRSGTSTQQGILKKIEREALTYGGERTKFLTGGEGSDKDRRGFFDALNPGRAAPTQMAGAIEGEYIQMKDALLNQEQQIRERLGDDYLKKNPIVTPSVSASMKRIESNLPYLRGEKKLQPGQQQPSPQPQATQPQGAVGQINSKSDYDRLPSGSRFIAPDGSTRIKP